MVKVIGVDACKGGWVGVVLENGRATIIRDAAFARLLEAHLDASLVFVDMPIGLPETMEASLQRPEPLARKLLGKKASSVFNVPCRQAVYCDTYTEANARNKSILHKGLSKQSFYISKKIKELDLYLAQHQALTHKIVESHPELCFLALHNGRPIIASKKTSEGFEQRLAVLGAYDDNQDFVQKNILENPRYTRIKDDVVDAYCLAVTAKLGIQYGLQTLPEQPTADIRDLWMQMVLSAISPVRRTT